MEHVAPAVTNLQLLVGGNLFAINAHFSDELL